MHVGGGYSEQLPAIVVHTYIACSFHLYISIPISDMIVMFFYILLVVVCGRWSDSLPDRA